MDDSATHTRTGRSVAVTINSGVISTGDNATLTVHMPTPVPEARWALRTAVPEFSGREPELDELLALLDPEAPPSGRPTLVATVTGMAGVGKTELAVRACHLALERGWFPGGVLFTDMYGYDDARRIEPEAALEGFLRALGVPGEHIPPALQDRQRLYASVLAEFARNGQRILVVIDNVAGADQARPLLPSDRSTRVIVTSRHTLANLSARRVELDVLEEESAVALLDRAMRIARGDGDTRVRDDPASAAQIARLCGRLPLALAITAALLADIPAKPLLVMAGELVDEQGRLARFVLGDDATDGASAVRSAFELSYRRLPADQALMFRLLSLNPGPDIASASAAVLVECDIPKAEDLLTALARAHLIEPGPVYGRWRPHDLMRLYSDELGRAHAESDERDQACFHLLMVYLGYSQHAVQHLGADSGIVKPNLFIDRHSAIEWLDADCSNVIAAVRLAAETGHDEFAETLAWDIEEYLSRNRRFDDIMTVSELALGASRRLGNRSGEASSLNTQGLALTGMRRLREAAAAYGQALEIYRMIGNRNGQASVLSNLGVALQEERRFEEALDTLQLACAIHRDNHNAQGLGTALVNLGGVAQELHRYGIAVDAYREAAVLHHDSGDRLGAARVSVNMCSLLNMMQHCEEAVVIGSGVAEALRELGDQDGEARVLGNVGIALLETGRFADAAQTHQRSVEIFKAAGDRHSLAGALNNLGNAHSRLRSFDEAINAHREAAALYQDLSDLRGEGSALNNLGNALSEVQRNDEAITAHRRAAELLRESDDPKNESRALENLGRALEDAQRVEEAMAAHQRAVELSRSSGDHSLAGAASVRLGGLCEQRQQMQEAIGHYTQAARSYFVAADRRGEAHAANALGDALALAGHVDAVVDSRRRVADIYEELGDRPLEGQATYNHGLALLRARRIDDAIDAFRRAAAICREVGELQCEGMALGNLGHMLFAMGQPTQARTSWLRALQAFREAGLTAEATQAEQLLRQVA